jgi:hypothetical protein
MSKERVDMGLRAAELMLQRDAGIQEQLEQMGLGKNLFNHWGNGHGAPSAMVLQKMEKAGYDVMYILTGRKSQPALPVTEDELRHLINDTIAYIWRLEERGLHNSDGYISRKALLQKLKQFEQDHFPQLDQCNG